MIPLSEAIQTVLSKAITGNSEKRNLLDSLGYVTAENIYSDIFMPPFDKSAVDGFACRRADFPGPLTILETIPAGQLPTMTITPGTCSRIMTGAKMPDGADCAVMVEYTEVHENKMTFTGSQTSDNFARFGEDLKEGDLIIPKNTYIEPQHIAVMATVGCTQPLVYQKPTVAIFSTGNELVEPTLKPTGGQIRNSNSYQLMAQCQAIGIQANYCGIIPDNKEVTRNMISDALKNNQIILLTGGVSMGDFDFVPEIMKELGFEIHFDAISVQPGKPTTFATLNDKYIFGLPGNPVSSFFHFGILVKSLIYKIMNHNYTIPSYQLPMAETYFRRKAERTGLIPAIINDQQKISIVEFHGSAHINALLKATGYIILEKGQNEIKTGEYATYRPF
ncbi:MAG: molybdopterin molybdenumtransferase MoeA [Bacteroidetes bacterium HGW-Bacteroidetes-21]|jgi:molybdopterin molybdotransferase|nr:MAG: molybdopterin molybdenumtransferase MoeA [Bacteroidetes bacterium HGW-Bacteroidetes-21]